MEVLLLERTILTLLVLSMILKHDTLDGDSVVNRTSRSGSSSSCKVDIPNTILIIYQTSQQWWPLSWQDEEAAAAAVTTANEMYVLQQFCLYTRGRVGTVLSAFSTWSVMMVRVGICWHQPSNVRIRGNICGFYVIRDWDWFRMRARPSFLSYPSKLWLRTTVCPL